MGLDGTVDQWRQGAAFQFVQLPTNAANILTLVDEVMHWVQVNLPVYASIRTILYHSGCERLVNWEHNQYDHIVPGACVVVLFLLVCC